MAGSPVAVNPCANKALGATGDFSSENKKSKFKSQKVKV
jgi:hypothetical protein